MSDPNIIRGFRVLGPENPSKQYSTSYLQQSKAAAEAGRELYRMTWAEEDKYRDGEGPGIPCYRDPDFFTGDDLPTDREAALACSQCPMAVFAACEKFAELERTSWGVRAGQVHGRKLAEKMKED